MEEYGRYYGCIWSRSQIQNTEGKKSEVALFINFVRLILDADNQTVKQ